MYSFWTGVAVVALVVAYLAALTRFYSGDGFSNLVRILYANLCLLLAGHHAAVHLATRSPRARAIVDGGFHFMDAVCGTVLLAVLGFLSLLGIVSWAQHTLLFSVSFARSIRRGQLVRTLGTIKTDDGQNGGVDATAVESALAGARSRAASLAGGGGAASQRAGSVNYWSVY